jgi:hypothetical protein
VLPEIKEIHVEKVRALTGPEAPVSTKPLDICGTDLGTMTEIGNRIELGEADNPCGPWSAPLMVPSAGQYPQLYGAFMTPHRRRMR